MSIYYPKSKLFFVIAICLMSFGGCSKNPTTPQPVSGTFADIDGNVYQYVTIGTQTWMVENLKTTHYNDGTVIPLVTDSIAWKNLLTPGSCWYNNDSVSYGNTYGALYNWYAVNTGKLAPAGWHVPSDAEWEVLGNYLGGDSVAGGKLKEAGTAHWASPNTDATNSSGFTALPGDCRGINNNTFFIIGNYGAWWSASTYSAANSWFRCMFYDFASMGRKFGGNEMGFSVRCVRD